MKILNLVQGSDEWIKKRLDERCASEAPVVMGASKFMTRAQLLDLKSGWKSNPHSSFLQKIFDKGHEHEDQARVHLEIETLEDWPALVGESEVEGVGGNGVLLASFDGAFQDDDDFEIWEHKDWNLTLAENVRNGVLEPLYYWQCEHQCLVSGADEVLFTCSDGTLDNRVSMTYNSVPERREELIKAWNLFQYDLESHEIKAKEEKIVVEDKATLLPSVYFKLSGNEVSTNIKESLDKLKDLANYEMGRSLESDADFAQKEKLNKAVISAREDLKRRVEDLKLNFSSFSDVESIALDMDSILQKMQAHGEKQVKQEKDRKKESLIKSSEEKIALYHKEMTEEAGTPFPLSEVLGVNDLVPDWKLIIKGKRTIKSIEDSLDTAVNEVKIKLSDIVKNVGPNFKFLQENADDYKFLFNDVFLILNQPSESFKAIVTMRVNDHKAEEEARRVAETLKIQAEATAKAEAAAAKDLNDQKLKLEQEARAKLLKEQAEERAAEEKKRANKEAAEAAEAAALEAYSKTVISPTKTEVLTDPVEHSQEYKPEFIKPEINSTDLAREKIKSLMPVEYHPYINDHLAGDFAVALCKVI